jgi:hypothetical protein
MSVLSREREAEADAEETRERMQQLAWAAALVRAAMPRAKTAGMAARDGVGAAQWTAPRINQARVWTAPRIEQSGLAIRTPSRRKSTRRSWPRHCVDVAARPEVTTPRRRWPQVVAGAGILVAVGARCGRRAPAPEE